MLALGIVRWHRSSSPYRIKWDRIRLENQSTSKPVMQACAKSKDMIDGNRKRELFNCFKLSFSECVIDHVANYACPSVTILTRTGVSPYTMPKLSIISWSPSLPLSGRPLYTPSEWHNQWVTILNGIMGINWPDIEHSTRPTLGRLRGIETSAIGARRHSFACDCATVYPSTSISFNWCILPSMQAFTCLGVAPDPGGTGWCPWPPHASRRHAVVSVIERRLWRGKNCISNMSSWSVQNIISQMCNWPCRWPPSWCRLAPHQWWERLRQSNIIYVCVSVWIWGKAQTWHLPYICEYALLFLLFTKVLFTPA